MAEIEVSVVVATRNRAAMLEALLDSLARQSLESSRFEVIVVDDGSTDRTPALLRGVAEQAGYKLRVVQGSGSGPAAARNRGWPEASAPLVAFTDDDCVATPDWLTELVEAARDGRETIVQGRTELAPGDDAKVGPFSRVLVIPEPNPFYATCNILYPRDLLETLNGFDEGYPRTGEDTDLGWRAREGGARYTFAHDAVVHHAVVDLGPLGKLRWALRWSDAMQVFRRHPQTRQVLTWRIFWKRSHALLSLALLGAAMSRRFPPAALLALPYGRMLRARCIVEGYSLAFMPYLALFDLAEIAGAMRGALRHRVLVL